MRNSRILSTFFLLACCGVTSFVTWSLTSRYDYEYFSRRLIDIRARELFPVVYCRKDIPANTKITEEYVELRAVHENILPANACNEISTVIGKKVRYPIKKGDALFLADFGLLHPSP